MGGISNPRPLAEPGCLGKGIDSETSTEIGGSVCALAGVRSALTTGTILTGEMLKSTRLFQRNVRGKDLISTHLSELESISIEEVGARDEDISPLKDPAVLQLVSDDPLEKAALYECNRTAHRNSWY